MDPMLFLYIALTVGVYAASRRLATSFPSPWTTPVFFSTTVIIAVLLAAGIDYQRYAPAKELMTLLLGPATVALAVPIYRNRHTLSVHAVPALAGIVLGSAVTLLAVLGLSNVFSFGADLTTSMSVKSVTAPIAIELASRLKGNPALAASFVIATGMIGAMLGPWLLTRAGIVSPIARGLALGTISHGQGTAQALTEGSLQGAMAGIAMGLSAILTSFVLPLVIDALL